MYSAKGNRVKGGFMETYYAENCGLAGLLKVTFIVNATGARLTRVFDSEYLARRFVNKLRFSKKCTLVSYPTFRD